MDLAKHGTHGTMMVHDSVVCVCTSAADDKLYHSPYSPLKNIIYLS